MLVSPPRLDIRSCSLVTQFKALQLHVSYQPVSSCIPSDAIPTLASARGRHTPIRGKHTCPLGEAVPWDECCLLPTLFTYRSFTFSPFNPLFLMFHGYLVLFKGASSTVLESEVLLSSELVRHPLFTRHPLPIDVAQCCSG